MVPATRRHCSRVYDACALAPRCDGYSSYAPCRVCPRVYARLTRTTVELFHSVPARRRAEPARHGNICAGMGLASAMFAAAKRGLQARCWRVRNGYVIDGRHRSPSPIVSIRYTAPIASACGRLIPPTIRGGMEQGAVFTALDRTASPNEKGTIANPLRRCKWLKLGLKIQ
jgi:hypothetical protein